MSKPKTEKTKTKRPSQIPLRNAIVAWQDVSEGGRVGVFRHPARGTLPKWADNTDGACWMAWANKTEEQQLAWLMHTTHQIVAVYGIKYEDVHSALCSIPEYVEALAFHPSGIVLE